MCPFEVRLGLIGDWWNDPLLLFDDVEMNIWKLDGLRSPLVYLLKKIYGYMFQVDIIRRLLKSCQVCQYGGGHIEISEDRRKGFEVNYRASQRCLGRLSCISHCDTPCLSTALQEATCNI